MFASTITECVSIFAFAPLISISIRVTSSVIGLKIFAITATTKKCKSIIKTKKKKHDEIVLLTKSKFNSIEVLISIGTCDSVISQDEFILTNNALKNITKLKKKSKIKD